jgi:type I restriction enzyme S subunit
MYGATIGRLAILETEATTNQAVCACTCFDGFDNRYLFLILRSYKKHFTKRGAGGAQPNISREKIIHTVAPLPPLEEQKRIIKRVEELMALCDELMERQQAKQESRERLNTVVLAPLNKAASLTPEELAQATTRLSDNFDTLYDSVDTVGKLRSTILQLAVQGKLVPQDRRDKPAYLLIQKIANRKASHSSSKRVSQLTSASVEEYTEGPFALPNGWTWTRFGEITINRDGERVPIEKSVRRVRQGIYDYYGASGVIDKIDDYLFDQPLLLIGEDGANLINRSTPIAFIAKGKYWVNNHAHVLDSISLECLQYLEIFINAIDLRPYITGTAQPKMNQAKMNSILVPFPPLAEQQRIVGKVNQLVSLCDEFETKVRQAEADSEKLMNAAVKYVLDIVRDVSKTEEAVFA